MVYHRLRDLVSFVTLLMPSSASLSKVLQFQIIPNGLIELKRPEIINKDMPIIKTVYWPFYMHREHRFPKIDINNYSILQLEKKNALN